MSDGGKLHVHVFDAKASPWRDDRDAVVLMAQKATKFKGGRPGLHFS